MVRTNGLGWRVGCVVSCSIRWGCRLKRCRFGEARAAGPVGATGKRAPTGVHHSAVFPSASSDFSLCSGVHSMATKRP